VTITPRSIDAGVGIGEIFVDKYRVDAILGHGGMGVVAACTHLALNERVAIKMLRKDVLDDADAVERFMREAQAAVKLKSEYVARVTDVGRSRSNVPYMVMEYLEGHDLGELLDERGRLGMPWAIELTLQACEALAEAHSLGIVHRDVKPTNLFVTWRPDGSALVKVLDFGISKALTGTAMQLTQTQSLLGTPAYMSPEQMRSARMVDARTDIWSLGTVLYEMIEGRRPFEAESFSEMCVKVAVDPPATMTVAPVDLQQVVLRCLEKAPEQRYASMADLARDLVPFAHDPHQAQVLVERMARMLRRSQAMPVEWNSSNSSSSGPVRQLWTSERPAETAPTESALSGRLARSSAPVPVPVQPERSSGSSRAQAERSSAPSPIAEPEVSGATPALPRRATGSHPALSDTLDVARPRRRGLWIATAVIVAAAIGVAISLLRPAAPEGRDAATADHREPSVPTVPAAATSPSRPPQPPSVTDTAREPQPTEVAPAAAVIVPAPAPGEPAAPTVRDVKPPRPGTPGNRAPSRANRGNKPAANDAHSPAKPPPAKDCEFADAHGALCVDGTGAAPKH
jgi:serine/threonine-protein kinase